MSRIRHKSVAHEPLTPSQLAHELNNLLDGSLRCVGLALRELNTDPAGPAHHAGMIKRLQAADRSMQLMAEVIERYANTGESDPLNPAQVVAGRGTMLDALTHAVNVYGPAIEQHGTELVTRLDTAAQDLPAGPIYTVLANAINNAIQAIGRTDAPRDHRIAVRILADDDTVLLQVSDTGPGLCPSLFDRLGRFRFGVTTREAGHGVGLGVCRQIARDLDGELTLANNEPFGTTFELRVPIASLGGG